MHLRPLGTVQVQSRCLVHLQKSTFSKGVCSLAYLLLTQVRKLPNASRPVHTQIGEFVVSGEIRVKSEHETYLSRKRQVGKYLVLRDVSRERGIGFDEF